VKPKVRSTQQKKQNRAKADDGPIDYDFVRAHLGSLMDELMPDLLQVFLEDGETRLQHLESSLHNNDWQQIGNIAHTLKGSSATLGMFTFSGLCLQLESAARCQDWESIRPLAGQLGGEFHQIHAFLTA